MSRPTNNSSGRGRGPEASRPHSASPSPPGSLRSDGDHAASASLADMLSAPSHDVAGEASQGDGFDAIPGGSPDVDSFLPPLLPILDSAPSYESPFSDWFEANFTVPDCRARLLSNHAAQPQLILDWLGLLYTAWRASTITKKNKYTVVTEAHKESTSAACAPANMLQKADSGSNWRLPSEQKALILRAYAGFLTMRAVKRVETMATSAKRCDKKYQMKHATLCSKICNVRVIFFETPMAASLRWLH